MLYAIQVRKNPVEAELLFIKCEKILENLKENFRKMWKYIENARKLLMQRYKKSTPNEVDFLSKYIGFSLKSLFFYYLPCGIRVNDQEHAIQQAARREQASRTAAEAGRG